MKALRLSFLFLSLLVASVSVPLGCGSSKSSDDAGGGGSDGGFGGARGTGGATGASGGTAGGTGGRAGSSGTDAGVGLGGAGGTIVMVDAAGNTFTCAELLACCNSITNTQGKALCLQQYNSLMAQGNMACGNLLAQIKANNVCP